jgi:hypothetical protein
MRFAWLLLVAVAVAAALLPVMRLQPNAIIPDDGYFYAQIAWQLGTHGRSSFDGLHATTGYHLPWGFVLGAVSRLTAMFTPDKIAHLFAQSVLVAFVIAATVVRFFRGAMPRLAAAVLLAVSTCFTEMVLVAPVLLLAMEGALDHPAGFGARGRDLLLLAALPFLRVDLVVVSLTFAAVAGLREPRRALRMAAAALGGAALQAAILWAFFDHFVSVSALLKTQSLLDPAALADHLRFNTVSSAGLAARLATTLLLGAAAVAALRQRDARDAALVLAPPAAFFLLHFCCSYLRDWYQVPFQAGFLFVAARGRPALSAPDRVAPPLFGRAAVAVTALLWSGYPLATNLRFGADQVQAAAFVADLRRHVPEGAAIFQVDGSGFIGYFADRDVVDGDGLVNSYEYARRLSTRALAGYLDEERICYFITDTRRGATLIDIGGLVVSAADAELVSAVQSRAFTWGEFRLWRLRAPRCALR